MARIRTIKPEFWTDSAIVECSTNARLLFVGTWTFADDAGNLDRSARQLKMQIFPADNFDCEPWIQELLDHGLLVEYSSNGKNYLHIQNFTKHQRIDRPGPLRCPKFEDSSIVRRIVVEDSSNDRRAFDPVREGKGRDKEKATPLRKLRKPHPELNGAFADFWDRYPRKKSKGQAEKAWVSIKPDEQLQDRILTAVERAKTSADWRRDGGKFIPYPASWLNAKGWEDEAQVRLPMHEPDRIPI